MPGNPNFNAEEAVNALSEQSGIEKSILQQKINEKITKFSGLLTEQGALVLISKELNVKLPHYDQPTQVLKLGELKPGMNNVDVQAPVRFADRIKPFSKNGKEGKYLSVRLADGSGEALYTFWNEQAEEAQQKGIRPGSILHLRNARVGSFNQMVQLSLGYNGNYEIDHARAPLPEGINPPAPVTPPREEITPFVEAQANQFVRTRVHVLDILPGKGYYTKCTACGGKPTSRATTCALCGKEGSVETRLLVSMLVDDGTKPLRGVAFENEVMSLYGKTKDEILAAMEDPTARETLNQGVLGHRLEIQGKTKIGMDSTTLELLINRIIRVPFENA